MSKMSDLDLTLNELKECGEKLIAVSDSLRKLFSGQQPTVEPQPEADPQEQITFEELREKMAKKTRVCKANTDAIRDLLTKVRSAQALGTEAGAVCGIPEGSGGDPRCLISMHSCRHRPVTAGSPARLPQS